MKACDNCVFIFYFLLNGFTVLSLCTFAKDYFTRFSILFHVLFFVNGLISFFLFLTIRKNPGRVMKANSEEVIDLSICNVSLDGSQSNTNEITSVAGNEEKELYQTYKSDCKICDLEIPMRGKHCSRCGVCIRKFDHHCFIIGGCVGERNHLKFYIYLFTQSLTLLLAIAAILDTVSFYLDYTKEKYSKVPFILYPLLLILSGYVLLTLVLFCFHTYLILTNQTTYEIYRKSRIPYINEYRELKRQKLTNSNIHIPPSMPFHPFDAGFVQNWKFLYYNAEE